MLRKPRPWMIAKSSMASVPLCGELCGDVPGATDCEGDRGERGIAGDGRGDDAVSGDVEAGDSPDLGRRRADRRAVVRGAHPGRALVVQRGPRCEGERL